MDLRTERTFALRISMPAGLHAALPTRAIPKLVDA